MHDFDPTVSRNNGHMLRNLSKYYLFICCKQSSSTHFRHFLATAFVTDVLVGSNPSAMGPNKNGPLARTVSNSVVGDEGCPRAAGAARFRFGLTALACCAGKRFAFPQLRTLSGSNPMRWAQTKTVPLRGPFPIQWWAMRDVACSFAARSRFGPTALACCAGKRLRVSSAPHPVGFESLCDGPRKERLPLLGA